jgi:hypothetical protein
MERNGNALPHSTKVKFSDSEDQIIIWYHQSFSDNFTNIKKYLPNRTLHQVRERFKFKLDPQYNHGSLTKEEDENLIKLVDQYDQCWKRISQQMPDRNDIQLKNQYRTLRKQTNNLFPNQEVKPGPKPSIDPEKRIQSNSINFAEQTPQNQLRDSLHLAHFSARPPQVDEGISQKAHTLEEIGNNEYVDSDESSSTEPRLSEQSSNNDVFEFFIERWNPFDD